MSDDPFSFRRKPGRPSRPQDISKTLQRYEEYRTAPSNETYTDYMMTVPFERPSFAQNGGEWGTPSPVTQGYPGTPSGPDTANGDGLRSTHQIMDFLRDRPFTLGTRESSNVEDRRDETGKLVHSLRTLFGANLPR